MNGDGYGDFLIGAPEDDHSILILSVFLTTIDTGSVRCVSGANGSTLWTVYGSAAGDELGFSLTNIGDVNGDGKADLAVGAPQRRAITPQPGYVRIASGANGATIATIAGSGSDSEFGYALAPMHDVTGDGYSELIVGVPGYSSDRGRAVRVNSGTWTIGLSWFGVDAGERFGSAVCAIGDVNNDNKADVLLGAPSNDAVASGGRVYCRSGVAATTLFTLSGTSGGEAFGTSVAPMMLDTSAAFAIGAPESTTRRRASPIAEWCESTLRRPRSPTQRSTARAPLPTSAPRSPILGITSAMVSTTSRRAPRKTGSSSSGRGRRRW